MAATPRHAMTIQGGKKGRDTMASKADRHVLYEDSVQCVEAEIDFVDDTFKKLRNRKPRLLREDFCGTASAACEWAGQGEKFQAIGVDIDCSHEDLDPDFPQTQ